MNKQNIMFIVNPKAGIGKHRNIAELIQKHLDHTKYDHEVIYTKYPKHAAKLKEEGLLENVDVVVAVGGDGSVNEVAKNVIHNNLILGVIPAGSGNGLARHLGIPLNAVEAIKRLNEGKVRKIDSVTIQNQLFLNVAGIGFDALVSKIFDKNEKRGFTNYIRLAMKAFVGYENQTYKINIDDQIIEKKAFLVAIANSSQYGNNAFIAPDAVIDDGKLEVCVLKPFQWMQVPAIVNHLFNKTLNKSQFYECHRGTKVTIQGDVAEIHYDGEPMKTEMPIKAEVQPSSLNVLT